MRDTNGEREEWRKIEGDSPHRVPCEVCGRVLTLWYNGGELDTAYCCGITYALAYPSDYALLIVRPPHPLHQGVRRHEGTPG